MHQDILERDDDQVDNPDLMVYQEWLLICPPDNWHNPIPVDLAEVRLLDMVSTRLGLTLTQDHKNRKAYLAPPRAPQVQAPEAKDEPAPEGTLRFPSGWTAQVVSDRLAGTEYEAIDPVEAAPLIPAFPNAPLSENFELAEFRPGRHSYKYIRISPALIRTLEKIRERAAEPVMVTSGYRPPAYNRQVGGVSNSTHIDGLAADIYVQNLSVEELHDICDDVIGDRGGVGYYPKSGFIHVDLRGYRARWSGS